MKKVILLIIVMVALSATILFHQSSSTIPFPSQTSISTWLWLSPNQISLKETTGLLKFCQKQGIQTIYIDISPYIDLFEAKNEPGVNEFSRKLAQIITIAQKYNIHIHGLVGNQNWTDENLHYIPISILNYIFKFNREYSLTPLEGVQFDLEFYSRSGFMENQKLYYQQYLKLVETLIQEIADYQKTDKNFQISFTVPYWLTDPVFYQTISKVDNSTIIILAYRNIALSSKGTVAISQNILKYVSGYQPPISILIGQETDNVSESNISFFGQSESEFKKQLLLINESFRKYPQFRGFAIHHLVSYQKMVKP